MDEETTQFLTIVSDASSRQLVGEVSANDSDEYLLISNPLMFMEQKKTGEHGLIVVPMFMPILLSEFVDTIMVKPISIYTVPATSRLAMLYRAEWDAYYKAAKASEAGIIITDKMPDGGK
jgi:hypothetical protein